MQNYITTGCDIVVVGTHPPRVFGSEGTFFFSNSRIPMNKILAAALIWLAKGPRDLISGLTGLSPNTVTEYMNHFRELIADSLDEVEIKVSGDGVVVEIDETKLGKRKYHRGHRVEGVWVLGGVERTSERKVFLTVVADRSAQTLCTAITKFVKPGSIIYTDLWKGYGGLEALGFTHMTVNHSETFIDEDTGDQI